MENGKQERECQAGCREKEKPWCAQKGLEDAGCPEGESPEGFRKVCSSLAMQIIETGEPKGLFWGFFGGLFLAIDSTQTKVFCEDSWDREGCFLWLRCERCADARGYVHFD